MALPTHLTGTEAPGLVPGQTIAQFLLGDMRNLVYLVIDWQTRVCAWVDPQADIETPARALTAHGLRLERILLTHTHFDHVLGLPALLARFPGVPVHFHADDYGRIRRALPETSPSYQPLADGATLTIGQLRARTLHAPGHSRGALIYLVEGDRPYLLTGDTIFIRDCGRTDLDTGSVEEMFATLQRVRAEMPPEAIVLPGHQYTRECASVLARELSESPPFLCPDVPALRALP
jgi:glyoxylase-like metal-dependent hydrolase (beta-lactamase superfamily II)